MFPAPHGAVCAALLPHVMETNLQAARLRPAAENVQDRYAQVARLLTGDPAATPEDGVRWVRALVVELGILPLRELGVTAGSIPELVAKAVRASSMKANPLPLTTDELTAILQAAI
jgi:alcohol dehydrogenase class IV